MSPGFDCSHVRNLALVIGPCSPDLADLIRQAAGIVENNMRAARIPDDCFPLLASAPYVEIGVDREHAAFRSRCLSQFAAEFMRKESTELASTRFMHAPELDWRSRTLEMIAVE